VFFYRRQTILFANNQVLNVIYTEEFASRIKNGRAVRMQLYNHNKVQFTDYSTAKN
jgi:hypothetical protein